MAQKLENFRKMSQSISAQDDLDVDDDEYTPHFQRVYITGEDNTGVSEIVSTSKSHQMLYKFGKKMKKKCLVQLTLNPFQHWFYSYKNPSLNVF